MASTEHRFRLHRRRPSFFDPINRMHLFWPTNPEGRLPLDADLTYILPALASGDLHDVNKTVIKKKNSEIKTATIVGTGPIDANPPFLPENKTSDLTSSNLDKAVTDSNDSTTDQTNIQAEQTADLVEFTEGSEIEIVSDEDNKTGTPNKNNNNDKANAPNNTDNKKAKETKKEAGKKEETKKGK